MAPPPDPLTLLLVALAGMAGALLVLVVLSLVPGPARPRGRPATGIADTGPNDGAGAAGPLPLPVWAEDGAGRILWQNAASRDLAQRADLPGEEPWPPPTGAGRRVSRRLPGVLRPQWFDIHRQPGPEGALCCALPVTAAVEAETALRDFVQTLTKTFAHLPIGLAIFDRERKLALFNPALVELTTIEPDWLIARPGFSAFLDRLRERRRIPEPRDYAAWRGQLAALEAAGEGTIYESRWPLPDGQTWRVTGRPHPEGAVAFLFEDITGEVGARRAFRSTLGLAHAALDAAAPPLAVFQPGGGLALCSARYLALFAPDGSPPADIAAARAQWQARAAPGQPARAAAFAALEGHVAGRGPADRAPALSFALHGGAQLACHAASLPGGATLLR
ncbi:MAG: PAS-domain containing protein, partial [Rhodobacteraceae bacterium]|nr:PAS-domain containing protein [Paracoccaceae bacterium]